MGLEELVDLSLEAHDAVVNMLMKFKQFHKWQRMF
jgi:hypothetical protein